MKSLDARVDEIVSMVETAENFTDRATMAGMSVLVSDEIRGHLNEALRILKSEDARKVWK